MKKLFLILATAICACYADEVEEQPINYYHYYWDVSVGPVPMPSVGPGVGLRTRLDNAGIDMGVSFRTLFIYNVADERIAGLYYFNSEDVSSFYVGFGLISQQFVASFIEDNHRFMATWGCHFILGHETYDDQFAFKQIEISTPQKVYWGENDYIAYIPDITLRFGVGF